jgi:hypothetical protein
MVSRHHRPDECNWLLLSVPRVHSGNRSGIISCIVLAIAIYARYAKHLAGAWRWIYVITATIALYFNCFVGVVMAFRRVPALHALAPTETEPPFQHTQLVVLAIFVVLTIIGIIRFKVEPSAPPRSG